MIGELHGIDIGVIGLYLIISIGIGLYYSRNAGASKEEFFLAGRSITWPLLAASLFATNISSQQLIGQSGLAYSIGIGACIFQMAGAISILVFGFYFLPMYLRMRLFTLPQFVEERFGVGTRQVLSGITIFMLATGSLAGVLFAGALVIQNMLGVTGDFSLYMCILVLGIAAGGYTFLGGLRSVVITDFIQNIVLILGGLFILGFSFYAASQMPDGLAGLLELKENMPDGRAHSKWSLWRPWDHPVIPWIGILIATQIGGTALHSTSHEYIQRGLGAKNLYHAQMGCVAASFMKILAVLIIGVPGVLAAYILQGQDIAPDQAYSALIMTVLPVGLSGIVLAALIAAIMSTIDSSLCACSSLFTIDFYLRKHKDASEQKIVRVGRATMGIILLFAIAWTPIIKGFDHLYMYMHKLHAYMVGPMLVIYLGALFYKRSTSKAAFWSLLIGLLIGFSMFVITNVKGLAAGTFKDVESVSNAFMAIHHMFPAWLTGINFLYGSMLLFSTCTAVFLLITHLGAMPSRESVDAFKRNDQGEFDDEPDYAQKNIRRMLIVFIILFVIVNVVFF